MADEPENSNTEFHSSQVIKTKIYNLPEMTASSSTTYDEKNLQAINLDKLKQNKVFKSRTYNKITKKKLSSYKNGKRN